MTTETSPGGSAWVKFEARQTYRKSCLYFRWLPLKWCDYTSTDFGEFEIQFDFKRNEVLRIEQEGGAAVLASFEAITSSRRCENFFGTIEGDGFSIQKRKGKFPKFGIHFQIEVVGKSPIDYHHGLFGDGRETIGAILKWSWISDQRDPRISGRYSPKFAAPALILASLFVHHAHITFDNAG